MDLPNEVLEVTLAQLSLPDLLLNVSCVCKRLRDLVASKGFVPWKKAYCRYKRTKDDEDLPEKVQQWLVELQGLPNSDIMLDEGLCADKCLQDKSLELFLPFVVTGARQEFWKGDALLFASVSRHRLYPMAQAWFVERMPGQGMNPVSACVAICLFATDVWDVMELIYVLLRLSPTTEDKTKTYSSREVTELLYFVAISLLFGTREFNLPSRHHHLVFQALYYFENDWAGLPSSFVGAAAQPSAAKKKKRTLMDFSFKREVVGMKLTAEQLRYSHRTVFIFCYS